MFTFKNVIVALSLIALHEPVVAQEPVVPQPEAEKLVPPKIGVVALGPKPGRQYRMPNEDDKKKVEDMTGGNETKGGSPGSQAVMLEVPEFAAPPAQAYYKISGKKDQKWLQLSIGFNNQVGLRSVPTLKELTLYRGLEENHGKGEENHGKGLLIKIPPLKPNTHTLLFLSPKGKGNRRWRSAPKITPVPLTWLDGNATRVLLVNTSAQAVLVRIGKQKPFKLAVNTKKSFTLPKHADNKRTLLLVKGENDSRIAMQDSIRPMKGLTKVYAFYQALPKTNGGRSLGVYRGGYDKPEPESVNKSVSKTNP